MNQLHMAYISLETPMDLKIKGCLREVGPRERDLWGQMSVQVLPDS